MRRNDGKRNRTCWPAGCYICTVTPISMTVGANRIVPAIAIPHPLGNPALTPEEEKHIRRKIVETALEALETEVSDQTIFEVK